MSLFQDDFYSTKVSRWKQRGSYGSSPRDPNRLFWLIAGSVGGGMVLMLLVVLLISGGSFGRGGSQGGSLGGVRSAEGENRVVEVAAKVRPTVVSVVSSYKESEKSPTSGYGLGSGVIFEKTGGKARIVTNNHVVEGASSYEVVLSNGSRKKAVVLGRDQRTDLAVMEVDASGIDQTAVFGDSDQIKTGQTAISIGNPLGINFAQTVTQGIISSPKVTMPVSLGNNGSVDWEMDVIQTDAAINQGNSGGALVNMEGKVIGINSMKVSEMGVEGLGFAIPINEAKPIIETLIRDKRIIRPYVGVITQDLQDFDGSTADVLKLPSEVKVGAVVINAVGPAKNAGLKMNDVIVELDAQPIDGSLALRKFLYKEKKVGDKVKVTYYRGGKKSSVTLILEELKDE
ncbi:S1C family serine protease [Gorillibacterium sp. sgz5001074]|uniref:S1C family serine protease n=1 Tax=Gorillibacterium sp. sgz5001074 TaxID=3446695 RepID=UPI003F67C844